MKKLKKLFKLIPVFCVAFVSGLSAVLSYDHELKPVKADWQSSVAVAGETNVVSITYSSSVGGGLRNIYMDISYSFSVLRDSLSSDYYSQFNFNVAGQVIQYLPSQLQSNFTGYNPSTSQNYFSVVFTTPVSPLQFNNGYTHFDITRVDVSDEQSLVDGVSYLFTFTMSNTGYSSQTASTRVVFNLSGLSVEGSYTSNRYILNFAWDGISSSGDSSYLNGYNDGYNQGFNDGYRSGSSNGYYDGYNQGYSEGSSSRDNDVTNAYNEGYSAGYDNGLSVDDTAATIFSGILQIGLVPINFFLAIFNFQILGINLSAFVSALLTVCLTVIVIKTITGKNGGD